MTESVSLSMERAVDDPLVDTLLDSRLWSHACERSCSDHACDGIGFCVHLSSAAKGACDALDVTTIEHARIDVDEDVISGSRSEEVAAGASSSGSCGASSGAASSSEGPDSDPRCDERPDCPASATKLTGACPPDVSCVAVTACGETIYCVECEGQQPVCDPGDTQVSGPSACLPGDAACYSRSTCGYKIWCTGAKR